MHFIASGVWNLALREIKKQTTSVSGPDMFGYSDSKIQSLIQELPNANKCVNYVWKNFGNSSVKPPNKVVNYEEDDLSDDKL